MIRTKTAVYAEKMLEVESYEKEFLPGDLTQTSGVRLGAEALKKICHT